MERKVSIKVNARHISQLGRELVTDYVTALVELVKNSYDADAEGVKVIFDGVKKEDGRIIIIDTGNGMTQKDIEEKWTVVGTNNKVRNSYSPRYGRKYAGKKGIGRFSVERLAERVSIISFPLQEEPFKFDVNWNRYEEINISELKQRVSIVKFNKLDIASAKYIKSSIEYILSNPNVNHEDKLLIQNEILDNRVLSYRLFITETLILDRIEKKLIPLLINKYQDEEVRIQDIENTIYSLTIDERLEYFTMLDDYYKSINLKKDVTSGIIMILEGLRDEWRINEINKIKKELRLLVAPKFLEENPFIINLTAEEFEIKDEQIDNEILDLHFAKISASIQGNGSYYEIIYSDKNNTYQDIKNSTSKNLLCGDLELELFYFLRDRENLSDDTISVTQARLLLDQFCGIKIYRDGFRVKPYGDEGNDWLLLDKRKTAETHGYLVGNNQVIGIIKISQEKNPLLVDATNREGIIENEAYNDLKEFVLRCTNLISNIRFDEYKKRKQEEELKKEELRLKREEEKRIQEEKAREERRKKEERERQEKEKEIVNNIKSEEDVNKLIEYTEIKVNRAKEEVDFYQKRLGEVRRSHEQHYENAKKIYEEQLKEKEIELNLYKNLASLGILTGAFAHETDDIVNRIAVSVKYTEKWFPKEVMEVNNKIRTLYLKIQQDLSRVRAYSELIVNFLKKGKREKYDTICFSEIIRNVASLYNHIVVAHKIDIEFRLDDFMSSFKMFQIDLESIIINMLTNSFEALKKTQNKHILIQCKELDDKYELLFEDNGDGVREDLINEIFKPFKTTKDDGIGLGLNIVKDIVDRYKGSISVSNSKDHGGAIFSIRFPKRGA